MSCQLSEFPIGQSCLLPTQEGRAKELITITHAGGSSKPSAARTSVVMSSPWCFSMQNWSGMSLSPPTSDMFVEEVSGDLCAIQVLLAGCSGASQEAAWTHPLTALARELLADGPGPKDAPRCANLPEERLLWGTTPDSGSSQGLAWSWVLHPWAEAHNFNQNWL